LAGATEPKVIRVETSPGSSSFEVSTSDGRIAVVPVGWDIRFEAQDRVVLPDMAEPIWFELDPNHGPIGVFSAQVDDAGKKAAAAQLADGSVVLVRRESRKNLFTGKVTDTDSREQVAFAKPLTHMMLDGEQRNLFAATADRELIWWSLEGGLPSVPQAVAVSGARVTAFSMLLGGRSLVVGQEDGALSVWFVARQADGSQRLMRIRDFPPHPEAIRLIVPSQRDKGFLVQDESGLAGLYYSTSERVLWRGESPVRDASALGYSPKADAAYLFGNGELSILDISNPHPEVGFNALFGKVWYEGAPEPAYVWQSSSGTDDFEPKLSLVPLLVGTLKGTVYSLLIAIPLAVFGAMYTSQFMHPRLKRLVKPTVEIMAALPSVVLGFLAGLWLAPRVERSFMALVLMVVVLPPLTIAAGAVWQLLPRALRARLHVGAEAFWFFFVLAGGIYLCVLLSAPLEALLFEQGFQAWLLAEWGLPYDQRNAIVVGLAMGFAVIPIIFAISEDAFSNVPRDLVSGSLALGANRWQTVTRVVLPTASAGIFSAIMVGFGRAVGETMIVLMATGNTPILDWNPFNGFRTLSANIAVEIPEAPQFGTLYRVLFLAALLLFVVTFIVNTAAELIRQRLRRRYARL
jgi:phosphate transport system permease protein